MSPAGSRRLAWSACVLVLVAAVAAVTFDLKGASGTGYGAVGAAIPILFSALGALIASRQPRNAIGWIFCGIGLSFGLANLADEYAQYGLVVRPGSLPGAAVASWLSAWVWPPGSALFLVYLLLLFPSGKLPSRRWRLVGWLGGAAIVLAVLPIAVAAWPTRGPLLLSDEPAAAAPASLKFAFSLQVAATILMFGLGLATATSLILRQRRAKGDEREQIKWFTYAGAFLVVAVILNSPLVGIGGNLAVLFLLPLLPVAAAIAILKYHLYDIDVVINKTVVYGMVAAFITAVYAALVIGVGAAIGSRSNTVLSAAAAAVVALAFQPVRRRAQRLADRLAYGKRATPYEVLSDFGDRLSGSYSVEDVLPRMARIIAEGIGASETHVWLRIGSELRPAASFPGNAQMTVQTVPVLGDEILPFPKRVHAFPVRHQGKLLGAITVTMPANEEMTPVREKLVLDLSAQAGLVLRNVRLLEELRASRQRLVAAQDEERRKLERNIHDGAQQQLVALTVKLRLAERLTDREPEKAKQMLAGLRDETNDALENLRDLARGIYPPLLADKGLAAALDAQARKLSIETDIDAGGIGRYAQQVESTVYFCTLEALQNVVKYSQASKARVHLAAADGSLTFEVADDGVGFDPQATGYGTGLQGMSDRLEAIGGTLEVRSAPGEGTTVSGRVPAQTVAGPVAAVHASASRSGPNTALGM